MNKFWKSTILMLLVCSMLVTTVFANPTENELKEDKEEAQQELQALEGQMESVMTKINETEIELIFLGEQIIAAEEELVAAEEKRVAQYEAMKSRIVAMYENGTGSLLELFMESGSIAEMLTCAENVQAIHEYDRKELDAFIANIKRIEELKQSLESDVEKLEKRQAAYEKDKTELNNMISELEGKIADLDEKIAEAARKAAEEAARKAAEEAAKREQESQQNGSNSSNNNVQLKPNYTAKGDTNVANAIIQKAYSYLGVPYSWGGSSYKGIDCSGLVMMAHKAAGISLPRYSGSQASGGQAVSRSEARPGDIVCYSGHVGIYLGNGQMIHAPHKGDVVRVASVYGSPWFRRYW